MVIQHNISSLNSWRNTKINNGSTSKNLEKLSSGFKINRSADDAAGLAISEKMRGQIRGTMMGTQNVSMGINLVQTAEGGLDETHAILQRMRELAVQSSNGTYQDDDRAQIDKEFQSLKEELDRIAESTHYNGIHLLDVSATKRTPITETVTQTRFEAVYVREVVPASQAIMNQIQSSVTNPPVSANGTFQFFAQNNNGNTSQLLFGGPNPGTSHPSIRVNNQTYAISSLTLDHATVESGGVWSTTFGLRQGSLDLTIVQNVSIVNNPTGGGQSYKIDYEVTNNNPSTPVAFDFMYHVDTQLGNNDSAPFEVAGTVVTQNTSYPRDAAIPGQVSIFDSIASPYIYGVITVNSTSGFSFAPGSEPDRLNLAKYNTANTYGNLPAGSVGDSGYSLIWANRTAGNQPIVMTTYYGVKNPPPDVLAGLGPTVVINTTEYRPITETVERIIGYSDDPQDTNLWIQSGANQGEGMYIPLCDARTSALGVKDAAVDPREKANESIELIEKAVNIVSSYRADFGASQNRLESTARSNGIKTENLQAAESTIRDVDMAKEMMEFTKNNILVQAGQSMLAQANQLPQGVLSLLK